MSHISKMSVSFLILWLECAQVSTADNKQVHIFMLWLHNYYWIALTFPVGPGLRIRATCSLPTHPPLVVLLFSFTAHQWALCDPWIWYLCVLHLVAEYEYKTASSEQYCFIMLIGKFSARLGLLFRQRRTFSFILTAELLVIKRKTWLFPKSVKSTFGK